MNHTRAEVGSAVRASTDRLGGGPDHRPEGRMPYGITNKFPGGTKEQYEALVAKGHPPDGLPDGQTHHFAGPTEDDGWLVIGIWDSKASWQRFRDDTLLPVLQDLGDEGLGATPGGDEFDVAIERTGVL